MSENFTTVKQEHHLRWDGTNYHKYKKEYCANCALYHRCPLGMFLGNVTIRLNAADRKIGTCFCCLFDFRLLNINSDPGLKDL